MTPLTIDAPEMFDAPIRLVLVGNERVTRAGLRMLLDGRPGIRVIAETECTCNVAAVRPSAQADIALVDLDCDGSLDFIRSVREAGIVQARLIALTRTTDSTTCSTAVQRGVLGVVSKQDAPETLIKAIQRVHAGEVWLNRAQIAGMLGTLRASAPAASRSVDQSGSLLPRERQIITLVARGLRNNEIAQSLFVSEATIRNCLGSIFRKLGISNRVHLLIYAIQEGFVNRTVSGNPSGTASRQDVLRLAVRAGQPIGEPNQS
jgi:DNA-binding NarL/FixJ family response regulator